MKNLVVFERILAIIPISNAKAREYEKNMLQSFVFPIKRVPMY